MAPKQLQVDMLLVLVLACSLVKTYQHLIERSPLEDVNQRGERY